MQKSPKPVGPSYFLISRFRQLLYGTTLNALPPQVSVPQKMPCESTEGSKAGTPTWRILPVEHPGLSPATGSRAQLEEAVVAAMRSAGPPAPQATSSKVFPGERSSHSKKCPARLR